MAENRTQGPIPSAPPTSRKMSMRSLVTLTDGQEKSYPVYNFSGKVKWERPDHAPFPAP